MGRLFILNEYKSLKKKTQATIGILGELIERSTEANTAHNLDSQAMLFGYNQEQKVKEREAELEEETQQPGLHLVELPV